MLIVGESINGAIARVGQAIAERDEAFIGALALRQVACGAEMLDVCAPLPEGDQAGHLIWTASVVRRVTQVPLVLDSADPEVLLAAAGVCDNQTTLSSISGEPRRLESLLPFLAKNRHDVIALCMDGEGIPETAEGRLDVARRLIEKAEAAGVERRRVLLDPLVIGVATDDQAGRFTLETLYLIREHLPGVRTVAAASNVSFGSPNRRLLNRTYLPMLVAAGLDTLLMDVRDQAMMSAVRAAEALVGNDTYCRRYLRAHREGKLV